MCEAHFYPTTGYGYDDNGRDTLDMVYADVFGAEDALVRYNIVNGTQAISLCFYGILRPGDTVVAATGRPYDTLEEVIGLRGVNGNGSLKRFRYKLQKKLRLKTIKSTLMHWLSLLTKPAKWSLFSVQKAMPGEIL
ncbi:MAG: methionine gamma-lyase family protein [Clostridiales bacterium]|nr:MAG: methionine gamma-lyase family protein [Clostridiales bacterium]